MHICSRACCTLGILVSVLVKVELYVGVDKRNVS